MIQSLVAVFRYTSSDLRITFESSSEHVFQSNQFNETINERLQFNEYPLSMYSYSTGQFPSVLQCVNRFHRSFNRIGRF
jgi:hypothetical protein